jgi:hypothetical protein
MRLVLCLETYPEFLDEVGLTLSFLMRLVLCLETYPEFLDEVGFVFGDLP